MTPTFKAVVEAMDAELKRQAQESGGHADQDVVGQVMLNSRQINGTFDLEKVARAALEAIPTDELAVAISAALDPDDFYVFGTTDGVKPGQREEITSIGIDGTGDLVATAGRALRALMTGVTWKPHTNGVLIASCPDEGLPPS